MKAMPLRSQIALAHTLIPTRPTTPEQPFTYQSQIALAHQFMHKPVVSIAESKKTSIELTPENRQLLANVEEIFIAGGGGAGRALPAALNEAHRYGLDLKNKVKVLCGTSVGTIACLGIAIGVPLQEMKKVLNEMPTDQFQDWNLRSVLSFFSTWGLCQGKAMPNYFKEIIQKYTGLKDPTFRQLYRAGYKKELRIVASNVSKHNLAIFSHRLTPHMKVSQAVGIACSVPVLFPPKWLPNKNSELEAFTDGGIIKNYPFGIGSQNTPLEKQLGFIFVNKGAAYSIQNLRQNPLRSLWSYIRSLLTMLVFQDPLCLGNNIKDRTVAIAVNHNPFKFTATPQEQRRLDIAGREAVRNMLSKWIDKNKKAKEKSFMPQFDKSKKTRAKVIKDERQYKSPRLRLI